MASIFAKTDGFWGNDFPAPEPIKIAHRLRFKILISACALSFVSRATEPFCALRFGSESTTPTNWPSMRAAIAKNSAAFDEVWFSTGISFPPLAWHAERARQCAVAAADLRAIGIVPSIEIQTIIGHTDDILETGDCSGQNWGTMVSAEGLAARHLSCPRDPKLLAYFMRVGELHAAWKPGSVWVDDDLSYRNRAPVSHPSKCLAGCFCDNCLKLFVAQEGRAWTREELADAIRRDGAVRARWDDFQCAGFGALTRAIAEAVNRVSPETVFGYQYGGELRPAIAHGLFEGSGKRVRLRPGAGAYWDTYPLAQLAKAYELQAMITKARQLDWVGACCPEIETCPRTFACRTPQGLILEAFENLALGMDFLSMFIADARTDESMDFYANRLFPRLASASPFLRAYRDLNRGTSPVGLTCGDIPPNLVACRGIPLVNGSARRLGELPSLKSVRVRMTGSGTGEPDANRVMQIISSVGLTNYYAVCDAAVGGRLPVVFDEAVRLFAVPRTRSDGTLVSLALVNCSIDRQDPTDIRLRDVPASVTSATWFAPEETPRRIPLIRAQDEVRATLPCLGAWTCGYLAF